MRGKGMPVLLIALLLSATGCSASTDASPGPSQTDASTTRSATPPPSPTSSPSDFTSCGEWGLFRDYPFPHPAAPAYAGSGPHPAIVEMDLLSDSSDVQTEFSEGGLPLEWRAYDDDREEWDEWNPERWDPSRAQLLICLIGVRKRSNTEIGDCAYDGANSPVYPATYTFEVYEVKTARRITAFKIRSDAAINSSTCPSSVRVQVGYRGPGIAQGIDDETLSNRLRPLITGSVE